MTTRVHAVYREGVLRPALPLPLGEGAEVELTITSSEKSDQSAGIADALAKIAQLPMEGPNDGFSGADHDHVLYGEPKKP